MSTDSAPEDMSPVPLCVSLATTLLPAAAAAADMDAIINTGCGCCAAGGLQYLYWFFMCCENEPE